MDDEDFFVEEDEKNEQGWIVTYSDLMSLLLCFFVLILSMAEVDIIKYKQIAPWNTEFPFNGCII